MAKLTLKEVETIAELAKLALTEEEKATFQEQLSEILNYAEVLQQVDTAGISPMTSALPLQNVLRPDEVWLSLDNADALYNGPAVEDASFKVKAVLD